MCGCSVRGCFGLGPFSPTRPNRGSATTRFETEHFAIVKQLGGAAGP